MTLTELLIASALIGIVITGAVSADFAIHSWQKRIEQRTLMQMNLARIMNQIIKDGAAATGSGIIETTQQYPWLIPACENWNGAAISYKSDSSYPRWIAFRTEEHVNADYICYLKTAWQTFFRIKFRCNSYSILASESGVFSDDFFEIITNPDDTTHVEAIEITLKTRPAYGQPASPLTNPEYSLTTRFFPAGVSQ